MNFFFFFFGVHMRFSAKSNAKERKRKREKYTYIIHIFSNLPIIYFVEILHLDILHPNHFIKK